MLYSPAPNLQPNIHDNNVGGGKIMSERFYEFEVFDLLPSFEPSPERIARFHKFINSLTSNVARIIIKLVCDDLPTELVQSTLKKRTSLLSQNDLERYLVKQGHPRRQVLQAFAEIRQGLRDM